MENISELLEYQREYENFIKENKGWKPIAQEKIVCDILALHTEVSEFAKELNYHKYWMTNKTFSREKAFEEYIDILTMVLVLGVDLGFTGKEVTDGYLKKRQININRQADGY